MIGRGKRCRLGMHVQARLGCRLSVTAEGLLQFERWWAESLAYWWVRVSELLRIQSAYPEVSIER